MAGKPKRMSQIKQLLQLYKQGKGKKTIARGLGMSKNTVKAYINKVATSELEIDELLSLEDPVLEAKLFAGNPSYKPEERYEHLKSQLPYYSQELKKAGVTRKLLWEEYRMAHPNSYSFTQFCYHLKQYQAAQNPSMVLHHKPGEKLYIDFAGKKLSYIDIHTGEIIPCQVFVACLPYSDYSFVMAVKSQRIEDFIYALICCLKFLGGVPAILVPDNLKAAINKASRYEPDINKVLEDFANHYGITVLPARAGKPQDKALVENQVKLIYSRIYAKLRNQHFFGIHSLNKGIMEKNRDHNQTRMQQKDYCREEKFIAEEKHLLKPLPKEDFEIKHYKDLKVAKNNHIYLGCDKHHYSVPHQYIGQRVKVIYTRSMVYIYAKGNQIAVHPRSYKPNGYSTQKEHLCSHHRHYLDRSPEYYLEKARKKSQSLHNLIREIFNQDKYPEQLYRTCDGLLNLQRKTNAGDFEKACQIALENGVYNYGFIKNILDNKMTQQELPLDHKPLPQHHNTRGAGYYK